MGLTFGRTMPGHPPFPAGARFAIDASALRVARLSLASARENVALQIKGNWLWIADASTTAAYADVQFSHDQGEPIRLRRGAALSGMAFEQLILTHRALPGQWLKLLYGVAPDAPLVFAQPPTLDGYPGELGTRRVISRFHGVAASAVGNFAVLKIAVPSTSSVSVELFQAWCNRDYEVFVGPQVALTLSLAAVPHEETAPVFPFGDYVGEAGAAAGMGGGSVVEFTEGYFNGVDLDNVYGGLNYLTSTGAYFRGTNDSAGAAQTWYPMQMPTEILPGEAAYLVTHLVNQPLTYNVWLRE